MKGLCFLFVAVFVVATAQARVERVEILSRADVLDGKPFGNAGTYEKVIGKVHFAVTPERFTWLDATKVDARKRREVLANLFSSPGVIPQPA